MFSKACEYGIKAVVYIAAKCKQNERVSLREIAKVINSPKAFTSKILQILVKNSIIESVKGNNGGFQIPKENLEKIKISTILLAITGVSKHNICGVGLRDCSPKVPCPIHHKYKSIRDEINEMLQNTTLNELADNVNSGLAFLSV